MAAPPIPMEKSCAPKESRRGGWTQHCEETATRLGFYGPWEERCPNLAGLACVSAGPLCVYHLRARGLADLEAWFRPARPSERWHSHRPTLLEEMQGSKNRHGGFGRRLDRLVRAEDCKWDGQRWVPRRCLACRKIRFSDEDWARFEQGTVPSYRSTVTCSSDRCWLLFYDMVKP